VEGTLVPWLSGHGPDPHLGSDHFDNEVARINELLKKKRTKPARLVGYSMGARVALGMLLHSPQLFSDAILIGVNPGLETREQLAARRDWESGWIDILEQKGISAFETAWAKQPIFSSQSGASPELLDQQRLIRRRHTKQGLIHALSVLGLGVMPNFWPRLGGIEVPVGVVCGDQDDKFRALGARFVDSCPRSRLVVVKNAGHNPLVDSPRAVQEIILSPPI
jgi:2-succinyl-6-hydroxy-2,4-cyclohexadiene-1-carboxylate synthase